ncbi:MAG: HU family DNA-binding protein [Rickettsiales bacterium]|jgi:nucleoid DNA-binding protein|nr:HU family DNA-binding protein [Rickettsiales bacterium]
MNNIPNIIKSDIINKITEKGIAAIDATDILDNIFGAITDALMIENEVKIKGFGTFKKLSKKQRVGRNLKTGETSVISARNTVSFHASKLFKAELNKK